MTVLASARPQVERLLHDVLGATHLEVTFVINDHPGEVPNLVVEFSGPDTPLLTARDGELLRAIEHLAAKVLKLDPAEHDLPSLDAESFKDKRELATRELAYRAAAQVLETGVPYTFFPMSSYERRRLHLAIAASGLESSSVGEGAQRAVIVHPPAPNANQA